jgi:hypothetical protein
MVSPHLGSADDRYPKQSAAMSHAKRLFSVELITTAAMSV